MKLYRRGDMVKVWWWTGTQPPNMARVIEAKPYTGLYREHFTQVLTLAAPTTKVGWLEMAA